MESYNIALFLGLWIAAFVLTRLGLSRMFKMAGYSPILAWVPILNWWYWLKLVGRPKWYMIGMIIPGVNILFSFNIKLDILRSFGKFKFWEQFLGIVLTFAYFPYLYFDKKLKFLGQGADKDWKIKHIPVGTGSREWADALLFAAYVAGGMRALYFDLYQIPTPSMESNLMVGDYLVVSRAKVGMRIPLTPITVPVVAPKEIFGFKAYSELLELPYMRLPGWYTIKNNDVIVFNWPADEGFPTDKKDNFVKRCVGIPGDSFQIIKGDIYINHKKLARVGKQQKRYLVLLKEGITQEFLLENELGDFNIPMQIAPDILKMTEDAGGRLIPYNIYTWPENAEKIKKHPLVSMILDDSHDEGMNRMLFPDTTNTVFLKHGWDLNNYGPFYLPKRGEKIKLTKANWDFLKTAINHYEKAEIVESGGKFYSGAGNRVEIKEYTFKLGYYWMMGDNRYNSSDSRYWGYVPEDHIIGKPVFTFFGLKKVIGITDMGEPKIHDQSMEYDTKGIRWNKIFRLIK